MQKAMWFLFTDKKRPMLVLSFPSTAKIFMWVVRLAEANQIWYVLDAVLSDRTDLINVDLQHIHLRVPDFVISSIDKNLIEDLVEARDVINVSQLDRLSIMDPHFLQLLLSWADVGVWAQQDVFKLGLLLVYVFNGLLGIDRSTGL